jgi:hypothetical protein
MTYNLTDLQTAVINQLGYETLNEDSASILNDVIRSPYGAEAGFAGFTYYSETTQFFDDNKVLIMQQLLDDRRDIGYDSLTQMLSTFNCFADIEDYNIEMFLINSEDEENNDQITLKNGLAWYALETVCRQLEEEIDELLDN